MPELDDISYSRGETIEAVRDFYRFLTKMYVDESRVIEPPAEGWPNITIDGFRGMRKTNEVIELLRHLPYLRIGDHSDYDQPPVGAECYFADYRRRKPEGDDDIDDFGDFLKVVSEGGDICDDVPAHVVGLTRKHHEDDFVFLLDTELGVVHWVSCPGEVTDNDNYDDSFIEQIEDDPYGWAEENEQEWRADGGTWSIPDFFKVFKQQFLKLNIVPLSERKVLDIWIGLGSDMNLVLPRVRRIWRKHGWPKSESEDLERFDKKACLLEIREMMKAHYPFYDEL
ncbi:hypothetical protein HJFPF1_10280 [Paramyrothecium foliicola]|nr:hypothetical protein HJFPF1_10280 [Paramyrothecium foliicola]